MKLARSNIHVISQSCFLTITFHTLTMVTMITAMVTVMITYFEMFNLNILIATGLLMRRLLTTPEARII